MNDRNKENNASSFRGAGRAWFWLTPQERKWVCVVAALALIGVIARCWSLRRQKHEKYEPPESVVEEPRVSS